MPRTSKNALSPAIERRIQSALIQVFSELETDKEMKSFCADFFSDAEMLVFVKRLAIAALLKKAESYESIRKQLEVSTATIASVAQKMHTKGFQHALRVLDQDDWADAWSSKLASVFKLKK